MKQMSAASGLASAFGVTSHRYKLFHTWHSKLFKAMQHLLAPSSRLSLPNNTVFVCVCVCVCVCRCTLMGDQHDQLASMRVYMTSHNLNIYS